MSPSDVIRKKIILKLNSIREAMTRTKIALEKSEQDTHKILGSSLLTKPVY